MIMCGPTELRWERRLVALVFRLSSRTLGAVEFPLLCRTASLSERPLAADELPPRPASFDTGIYGCVNWSQPICEISRACAAAASCSSTSQINTNGISSI